MFLAQLLNKAKGNRVLHEPTRIDFLAYTQAYYDLESKFDYISKLRKRYIYLHNHQSDFSQYGEVNSILRRHSQALRRNIPNLKLFYLVRDGRDVVRSMMARRAFTYKDPNTFLIKPNQNNQYYKDWPKMGRFERLCWYWREENVHLNKLIGKPLLFEKLIKDYEYFKEHLLNPLELDISREQWANEINLPKNPTTEHVIPHWEDWDIERTARFERICGDLMKSLGYDEIY
jgi:hypothetical protein